MIGHFPAPLKSHKSIATAFLSFSLVLIFGGTPAYSQAPPVSTAPAGQTADHSAAYYDFAMAHLYAELASAYGNRGEYVNKAIDLYRQAMKTDPSSPYIAEELTEFYVQTGQLEKALQEADNLLKANPGNTDARRILARVYSRQIGDPEQGRVDQAMLKNAIEQYRKIADQEPKDSESLSMLAKLYRVSKDEDAAEKVYKQVIALDPNDAEALTGLAMVYADRGDIPNAIPLLKQAVEKNPDPRTVVMLAEFYEQVKDFSSAAETMKQALALTNGNSKVLAALANDLYAAGRTDEALAVFRQLAADDPKNVVLQLQIAEILEKKKDFEGAASALAKAHAAETAKDKTEVAFAEEELLRAQGKTPQAIASMQALLNDTKKDIYTDGEKLQRMRMLQLLGAMQQDSGKIPDAVAAFRQINDLDPTLGPRVEAQIVEAYKSVKDYKQARQEADSALKKYPSEKGIVFEHALLLADLGQTEAALAGLRALPNSAKDRDALLNIAQVQDKAKRFEDERKTLDAADALSTVPQDKQAVEFMRGAMYEREKNFDAAEKSFRNILQADPANAGAMNYLGYMYADRNVRLEEARQLISKALDLDPGNGAYEDSLGWVLYRLNRLDQAVEQLRLAVDKVGNDPTVHDHLGDVYFKQGKIREAIQQWEVSVSEWKIAAPGDQDPVELAKVTRKLEGARVRVAEKAR
ncbi:MAG: tetratricopeptide repeat protein [Acidobacteriota bacterium]|nr:tetratricopeptide repeat protein [Acidobacteriota bacterium]